MIKIHFWQLAVARLSALLIGIVIGTHWHECFATFIAPLVAAGVIGSLYVLYVVLRQFQSR